MKILLNIFLWWIILFNLLFSQDLVVSTYGSNNTLDIATWNIEWFPKNNQITIDKVSEIIDQLNLDIIAIQEVDGIEEFDQMISSLPTFSGYYESAWFAGLAFIYNNLTISVNNIYEIYNTSPYWSPFPRSPMVLDINYGGENYIIINNHFKCCGDGILDFSDNSDEENRRYIAMNLLKDYIDNNFSESKVIVLGDLNDDIAENSENNVFQNVLNDSLNFKFADYHIASGDFNNWSFPNWPSHLDHILITNELFDKVVPHYTSTLKIDTYLPGGWNEYDQDISDHRPVAIKIIPQINVNYDVNNDSENNLSDINSLILLICAGIYQIEYDYNYDSNLNLIDILKLNDYLNN